jgi:fructokinase
MRKDEIEHIVDFANAVGSLATTKHGAIPAMPELQEVLDCCANTPHL